MAAHTHMTRREGEESERHQHQNQSMAVAVLAPKPPHSMPTKRTFHSSFPSPSPSRFCISPWHQRLLLLRPISCASSPSSSALMPDPDLETKPAPQGEALESRTRRITLFIEPSPFAYVSSYKNRFQNFIKYLWEVGGEVIVVTTHEGVPQEFHGAKLIGSWRGRPQIHSTTKVLRSGGKLRKSIYLSANPSSKSNIPLQGVLVSYINLALICCAPLQLLARLGAFLCVPFLPGPARIPLRHSRSFLVLRPPEIAPQPFAYSSSSSSSSSSSDEEDDDDGDSIHQHVD